MKLINKIGFIVHEPVLWAHYSNVWKELDRNSFSIILTDRFKSESPLFEPQGSNAFIEKAHREKYELIFASDLRKNGQKYKYIVSNHIIGGTTKNRVPLRRKLAARFRRLKTWLVAFNSSPDKDNPQFSDDFYPKQYFPLQLGEKQIRFMYGADISDGWSLASWNDIYDIFLCHGPNDQEELSKRFRGKAIQMGYPRYDEYFNPLLDTNDVRTEFNIDPLKKTVLWMPTYGDGACSIPFFADTLAKFTSQYNFVVRPHPISFLKKPGDITLLESYDYKIDRNPVRDMNKLYRLADFVLCDYGGSSFGAIYLDKALVLLDVPNSQDWFTVRNSTNLELTHHFQPLSVEACANLDAILEDEAFWSKQMIAYGALRRKYFADFRGNSSKMAADILSQLHNHLRN